MDRNQPRFQKRTGSPRLEEEHVYPFHWWLGAGVYIWRTDDADAVCSPTDRRFGGDAMSSIVPRFVKTGVDRVLARLGLRLRLMPVERIGAVDVRGVADHPSSLLYYGRKTAPSVLVEAPIRRGYSLEVFSLRADGSNPFVCAIRNAIRSRNGREAIRRTLAHYYRAVRPKSAAQWLGITADDAPEMASEPVWARLLPWEDDTVSDRKRNIRQKVRSENRRRGEVLSIHDGWKLCGPVSEAFLRIQSGRLYELYRSIARRGLVRHDEVDGDIRAVALIDGDRWRWLQCGGGFHRAAVAAALGYRSMPVRIWRVVYRRQVELWPQVARGEFTREGALAVFDRIFSGKSPAVVKNWRQRSRAG